MTGKSNYREKQNEWFGTCSPEPLKKRYSIAKVCRLYKEIYNVDVIKIPRIYKGHGQYYEYYKVVDSAGNVLVPKATLYALGQMLDRQGDYI